MGTNNGKRLYIKLKQPKDEIETPPRKPVHGAPFVIKLDMIGSKQNSLVTQKQTVVSNQKPKSEPTIAAPVKENLVKDKVTVPINVPKTNKKIPHSEVRILELNLPKQIVQPLPKDMPKDVNQQQPTSFSCDRTATNFYNAPAVSAKCAEFNEQQQIRQLELQLTDIENQTSKNSLPYAKLLCDEIMPNKEDRFATIATRKTQTPQWLSDMCPRRQKMMQEINDLRKSTKEKDHEIKKMRVERDKVTTELLHRVSMLQQTIYKQNTRINRLEALTRKKNVLVYNVEETESTSDELLQIVIRLMFTIGITLTPNDVDNVERLHGDKCENSRRPILLALMTVNKKRDILNMKRRALGFSIEDDMYVDDDELI